MGLLLEYFIAPSADAAATAVQEGPGHGGAGEQFATLNGRRLLDPAMGLGALDAALTGRTFAEVLADESADVFTEADGRLTSGFTDPTGASEAVVIAISTTLQDALVAATENELRAAAEEASMSEDLLSPVDPEDAADFAVELAELVRAGRADGGQLFAWWCP